MKYGGRTMVVGAIGTEIYNVATAPEGQRVQEAAHASGRLAGGAAGAWAGAQVGAMGGPWGAAAGAAVGGVAGAIGGDQLVNRIFD